MKKIIALLVMLLLAVLSITYLQGENKDVAGHDIIRLPPSSLLASDVTRQQAPTSNDDEIRCKSIDIKTSKIEEFPFSLYITPAAPAIVSLSARISEPEEAYETSVQWVYVSEKTLNGITDKWLTPQEFLTDTSDLPGNPLKGREVGDCEEQANALVSLIRAKSIQPEQVRVAVGEIIFNNEKRGHVCVELFVDEKWLVLDPTCGPY